MVTSPYRWKILEWNDKLANTQTEKKASSNSLFYEGYDVKISSIQRLFVEHKLTHLTIEHGIVL